jgi:hypothetical protein
VAVGASAASGCAPATAASAPASNNQSLIPLHNESLSEPSKANLDGRLAEARGGRGHTHRPYRNEHHSCFLRLLKYKL